MKNNFNSIMFGIAFLMYVVLQWTPATSQELQLSMLNIGQGDAFYIRTPAGNDMLIDGGPDRSVLSELGAVMPPYDHQLEWVIATHPDADHITGIVEAREVYAIGTLVVNGDQEKSTGVVVAYKEMITRTQTLIVTRGQRIEIEKDLWITILSPAPSFTFYDTNEKSIVFILQYKEKRFLFTGDASIHTEEQIMAAPPLFGADELNVDLLKISHHGSKTGTSDAFLQATTPSIALISAGKDNRYGHPHAAPLYRLRQIRAQVFRTDQDGRVQCRSDGYSIHCL